MEDNTTLEIFDLSFQEAIIGHMLEENWFCNKSLNQIKSGWFSDPNLATIFAAIQDFSQQYRRTPTPKELRDYTRTKFFTNHGTLHIKIDQCVASAGNIRRDYVSKVATGWLRLSKFKNYVAEAVNMYNKDDGIGAIYWIDNKIAEIKNTSFLSDDSMDFSNPMAFYKDFNKELDDCLTLGHPDFDELLRPGSKCLKNPPENIYSKRHNKYYSKGSLGKGDTTMIIGPSNAGKTTTVISILVANILSEKHCLFVTHEQNARDIVDKIFQCFFQMSRQQLINPNEKESKEMQHAAAFLNTYLTYVPWVKSGGMYSEDVVDMIREKNSFLKSKNNGKGFDLVIDDYPGKLGSRNTNKNQADHALKTYVYDQFVTLAIEEQFHVIVPLQANRGGFKKAKDLKSGGALIDQSDVADAYNIVQRASNVITINSSKVDKEKQVTRYLIDKSRSSQTGKIFVSSTAFDKSTSHSIFNASTTYSEGAPRDDVSIYAALGATESAKIATTLSLIQGE